MHPEHPKPQRIGGGKRSEAHQRFGDWNPESSDQFAQLRRGARPLHAAADIKERGRAFFDSLDRALDLPRISANRRLVAAQIDFVGIFENVLGLLHVLGQIDDHRTGASAAGDIKCFLDSPRDIFDVLDQEIVFGAGPGYPDEIGFLKRVVADSS